MALEIAGYDKLRKQQEEGRKKGKYLGIGLSSWIEICGFGPSAATAPATGGIALVESAQVRVFPTGSVAVYVGTHSHGQGHDTTFPQIVADTLRHFEGERVVMISFAVMPNHVHALFVQNPEWPLEKLTQSWKRFAARQINKLLERSGNFWQRDYFDRLVRDGKHFANCVRYIRRNPGKAGLNDGEFILYESEIARTIELLRSQGATSC